MKCFLDMDGVIVDFASGALRLHNQPNPYLNPANYGKWDLEQLFGMTRKEFFYPMNEEFWWSLNPMYDGFAILEIVEQIFGKENICLLTSPTFTPGCYAGKFRWINYYLPDYKQRHLIGFAKYFLASENKILIDDHDKNVDLFREHGGKAILLPRLWNSLWSKDKNTLSYLKEQLEGL